MVIESEAGVFFFLSSSRYRVYILTKTILLVFSVNMVKTEIRDH